MGVTIHQLDLDGNVRVVGSRPDDDFYQTPRWLIRAALRSLEPTFAPKRILDPCAGLGVLTTEARAFYKNAWFYEVELDFGRARHLSADDLISGDFFSAGLGTFDLIICNPPFNDWARWAEGLQQHRASDGILMVLGFANHLGGQKRQAFWKKHPPQRIMLSPRRASFTQDGQTDPRDAVWFVWGPETGQPPQFQWLDTAR